MAQNPNGFLNKHMKKKFPPKNKNEPRENTEQKWSLQDIINPYFL